jgi:hypothetical protein
MKWIQIRMWRPMIAAARELMVLLVSGKGETLPLITIHRCRQTALLPIVILMTSGHPHRRGAAFNNFQLQTHMVSCIATPQTPDRVWGG